MKLHEYQARDLLAQNGVAVTKGRVGQTPAEGPHSTSPATAGPLASKQGR